MSGAPLKPWQQTGQSQSSEPKPWEIGQPSTGLSQSDQGAIVAPKPWEINTAISPSHTIGTMHASPYSSTGYTGYTSPYSYRSSFYGQHGVSPYGSTYTGAPYGTYNSNPYGVYSPYSSAIGQPFGSFGNYGQYSYQNNYGHPPGMPPGPMPAPPTSWQSLLAGLNALVNFFGRVSFLVEENSHAVHFFVTALLQLLDRLGSLYSELARFILRLLGYKQPEQASKQGQQSQQSQEGTTLGAGSLGTTKQGVPLAGIQESARAYLPGTHTATGLAASAGSQMGSQKAGSATSLSTLQPVVQQQMRWDNLWSPVQGGLGSSTVVASS